MLEKYLTEAIEGLKNFGPYLLTFFLSCLGGTVKHMSDLKVNKLPFNWRNFLTDLLAASFAGLLTHFLCEAAKLDGSISAVLIAISGHMGTKAIVSLENVWRRVFNLPADTKKIK